MNTTTGNFSYQQGFQWGTNLLVGFNNQRQTIADAPFQQLSPQLNSSFNFRITQHLLQGFGFAPNTRFIQIAKNNREISDVAFRLQITTTVDQIENMYWDLVFAYENVRVQQEQLAFAAKDAVGQPRSRLKSGPSRRSKWSVRKAQSPPTSRL